METKLLPSLEDHLGYWLRLVSNQVSGAFARALQERQVSVAEWAALRHVHDRQDLTPGELADALGLTRGAVSKVLDKLENKQWIARTAATDDGRVQLLSLTRQGRRVLPELAQIANSNDERFFDCLTAGEHATLRRLLKKIAEAHQLRSVPMD